VNRELEQSGINAACVNCAVEASSAFPLFRYFGLEAQLTITSGFIYIDAYHGK